MKTLLLVRHAKSSRDIPDLPDRDRPLNDRGRRDAPTMGQRLARREVKPDLILSSPALRARSTAEILAKALHCRGRDVLIDDRLYASAAARLLDVIQHLDDKLQQVMLVGHNPELAELAHSLSSEVTQMPTCAVAEFKFAARSWGNIGPATLAEVAVDYPKKSEDAPGS